MQHFHHGTVETRKDLNKRAWLETRVIRSPCRRHWHGRPESIALIIAAYLVQSSAGTSLIMACLWAPAHTDYPHQQPCREIMVLYFTLSVSVQRIRLMSVGLLSVYLLVSVSSWRIFITETQKEKRNTSLVHELTQIKDPYNVRTFFLHTQTHTSLSAYFVRILFVFFSVFSFCSILIKRSLLCCKVVLAEGEGKRQEGSIGWRGKRSYLGRAKL